jgi:DNA replication protein DnaC
MKTYSELAEPMNEENMEILWKELGLKTPSKEVSQENKEVILNFLNMEKEYRKQHRIQRLLRMSGIKQVKTLKQFDWHFNPKISREEIMTFINSPWIENAYNLVLIGDTGLGKSHIAKSICYEAILQGHVTAFISSCDLITKVKRHQNPASKIDYFAKIRVLGIDELGFIFHKKEDTDILFQIISKRAENLPTLITTNLAPKEWGTIFSGAAASAILDRLSFNGKFLTFEGRSYRLLKKQK